jgi:large subunit ribosomal protein L4
MATIDVYNLSGAKAGTMDLADEVFAAVNEDLLWEAVTHYRASARAGTHATKNRWRVSGSGKKLWKQKGTGRARIGSIRSPLWRHGGTVHGPQPRSYDYAFPKKKLLGALRSALASKFADGKLMVVKAFDVKEPKTKLFREALDKLKVDGTALLVDVSTVENKNLALSSRNIDGLELVKANEVHPYHIMRYTHVVFAQPALEKLQDSLKKTASHRDHEAEPAVEKKKKNTKAAKKKSVRRSPKAEVA